MTASLLFNKYVTKVPDILLSDLNMPRMSGVKSSKRRVSPVDFS